MSVPSQPDHAILPRIGRMARSVAGVAARSAIRAYQLTVSAVLGRQCRYLPTCSEYADEAIRRHGVWRGGWMGAARLCRCHPLGPWGYDPVPVSTKARARWYLPWRYGVWDWRRLHGERDGGTDEAT